MVTQHYRWDFVGLSTDDKPTPDTSEKVVDGSTYYCSDTSKLYVFCKDTWYERKPLGGGGGTTYTAGDGIDITDDTISIDPELVATLEELDERIQQGSGTPTTATEGLVGGLYEDTTNGKLYICTAIIAGTDPDPDTYTWSEVGAGGGSVTVVQTTGNSTTDVMSQNATTSMIYANPSSIDYAINIRGTSGPDPSSGTFSIAIGGGSFARGDSSVTIGTSASNYASGSGGVTIGHAAKTNNCIHSTALGTHAEALTHHSVALGGYAQTTRDGEVNIGTGASGEGYNLTNYRVIGGVHDGQLLHDAATVAQGNTLAITAPDINTYGVLGQLWTDTTNMHTYQCTAISGDNYTWTQRW